MWSLRMCNYLNVYFVCIMRMCIMCNLTAVFQVVVILETEGVVRAAAAGERLELQADGTFRVVPRLFKQLLVVFLGTNGRMLPAFYEL